MQGSLLKEPWIRKSARRLPLGSAGAHPSHALKSKSKSAAILLIHGHSNGNSLALIPPVSRLIARLDSCSIACAIAFLLLSCPVYSQTYQVGPDTTAPQTTKNSPKQATGQQLGWGSNIQNARLARAAELALQRGDHALALDYAQRAAHSAPNDPQLWFLLGYAARLDGRYGQALDAYKQGLHLSPGSLDGTSGLAQTYSLMGRNDEATRLLQQIVATNPGRRNDVMLLGEITMHSGDYKGALEWLNKAEHVAPDARAELLMAICYQHLNQMDLANHYLQLAKSRAPNNPDVERSLAGFYRDTGDYDKAIAALKTIKNPHPDVLAEMGYTYGLAGKLQDSAHFYAQAANASPRDLALQLSAAQAEVANNELDRADPFLSRAAQLNPNYYRLHAIRGEIAQMQDRAEDSVREYTAAVASLPATPVEGPLYGIQLHMNLEALYQNLGDADHQQQQLKIAQSEISALNEQGADRASFLRLRALIEMDGGQTEAALNDMKESLMLSPHDPNSLQLDGDVLMKLGRTQDAIAVYQKVLAIDPKSRFALTSLGYAERAAHDDHEAERYFDELAQNYPNLYVPYLALGDLYTERHEYKKAQTFYAKGYGVAPKNALIVAGGMNAAIEAHNMDLAGSWLHRVSDAMKPVPEILEEEERYYRFDGNPQLSADVGHQALKVLPRNRDVVVYLGYDLLSLNQYPELLDLTQKYMDVFPTDADIPLLAGYVYKHDNEREKAVAAFTESIKRDPTVVTAYVNRGYVLNDLHKPVQAEQDFEQALSREPKNGEAHLGLAFADLAMNHNSAAVHQSELAEATLGDSEAVHLIRATGYGREGMLMKAAAEYHAALKFNPNDGTIYLDLASIYFGQRRFHDAATQLDTAQKLLPDNAQVYALEARNDASLEERDLAMKNIELAEHYAAQMPPPTDQYSPRPSDIYISTGEALSTLGDQKAAMGRFSKALVAPWSNRAGVRLAVAQLMVQQGHEDAAERQIALAQMEAEAGDTVPMTGDQYIEAAGLLQQMHQYQLSETYLQRARAAGASDIAVRTSLANSYLALGDTTRAAAELAAVSQTDDTRSDYAYLLAQAAVYQQQHHTTEALSAFAQAASAAGEDQTAEQDLLQTGANEGYRINSAVSVLSNLMQQPIFEDSTVYVLDSKTFGNPPPIYGTTVNSSQLPPPRYTIETDWTNAFHLHLGTVAPTAGGFFQIRNARGLISVPAIGIVNRDTTDYNFNFGVNPTVRVGANALTFNSGFQGTIRRDSISPTQMDQNMGRFFTYMSTTSFFHVISADGYFIRDFGPFTKIPLDEHTLSGAIDFRVGAPWSKTALVTGWGSNDQTFTSTTLGNTENYYTSAYIGINRRFSDRLSVEGIAEDLRTWRIVPFVVHPGQFVINSGTAQALRPAATLDFSPTRHWAIQASSAYESTRNFHLYDMTQNGIVLSYMRPFGRTFNEDTGDVTLKYPIRISAGVQEQTFLNFTQGRNQEFRPYVSITLF